MVDGYDPSTAQHCIAADSTAWRTLSAPWSAVLACAAISEATIATAATSAPSAISTGRSPRGTPPRGAVAAEATWARTSAPTVFARAVFPIIADPRP